MIKMLHPRSAELLVARTPALPAHTLDLSAALAEENLQRRTAHKKLFDSDQTIFRKTDLPESASSFVHHQQIMKNLLGDMHPLKDPGDLDKKHKYTRSIKYDKDISDRMALDEYHFQTMPPIEDFLRPGSPVTPRSLGYEPGHIRSLLKLDTYGPAESVNLQKMRDSGLLPITPNIDRHKLISPYYDLRPSSTLRPRSSSINDGTSTVSSTTYDGAFPSLKNFQKLNELKKSKKLSLSTEFIVSREDKRGSTAGNSSKKSAPGDKPGQGLSGTSSSSRRSSPSSKGRKLKGKRYTSVPVVEDVHSVHSKQETLSSYDNFSIPHSAGAGQLNRTITGKFLPQTFPGMALTTEDRLLGDPFLRRTTWAKSYVNTKKEIREDKRKQKEYEEYIKEQKEIAEVERKKIDEFDDYVVLARMTP